MCRFHIAQDLFEKLKVLDEIDHLEAVKRWKQIERSKSEREAREKRAELCEWCDESETRQTFKNWAQRYLRDDWLFPATDIGREENYGLFYTNNACEAAIRNLIPTESKHIAVIQFLHQLIASIERKEVELKKMLEEGGYVREDDGAN